MRSGLENRTKQAIDDHADAQGAMNAAARKKKKGVIWNEITVFLQQKKYSGATVLTGSIFSGPARSNRR